MSTLTDSLVNNEHHINDVQTTDDDDAVTIPDSYRAADIIGQIERLRCSPVGLLQELGRLRIELDLESQRSRTRRTPRLRSSAWGSHDD